jgi:4-hydroxy-2-oxoheptanedioate aldolase
MVDPTGRETAQSREGTAYDRLVQRRRLLSAPGHEVSLGMHLSFLDVELVELCGHLGFDWVCLDAQDTALTPALSLALVRAANRNGMPCLVRVPCIDVQIESYLDAGVAGVVANINSAADAQALVDIVKFPPRGARQVWPGSCAAGDGLPNPSRADTHASSQAQYYLEANAQTCTAALIGSPQGIKHLPEILAVPGLNYIALEPHNLARSIGVPNSSDERVRTLLEAATAQLRAAGKPRIEVVWNLADGQRAAADGARLIAVPAKTLVSATGTPFLQGMRSREPHERAI